MIPSDMIQVLLVIIVDTCGLYNIKHYDIICSEMFGLTLTNLWIYDDHEIAYSLSRCKSVKPVY
jgi:hypothetical protein